MTISNSFITSLGLRNITTEAISPAINPIEVPIPTKFPKDFIQPRIQIRSFSGKKYLKTHKISIVEIKIITI